jgi:sulfur relay (sulfurtransferase) DsrF/TusC family protein
MGARTVLIYCVHGTYGRDDDAYGAMLMTNASLAKGMEVALVLADDGVTMALTGQDTSRIGLPNNLDEIQDTFDLGGRLLVVREALAERGIREDELVEGAEVIDGSDLAGLMMENDVTFTF